MTDSGSDREIVPQALGGRKEARLVSVFTVRIVWVDMSYSCHGRLRDVSPGGARIVAEGGEKPRGDIHLLANLPGEAEPRRIDAKLRWQVGETLGVRFEPAITLELLHALAGLDGPPPN